MRTTAELRHDLRCGRHDDEFEQELSDRLGAYSEAEGVSWCDRHHGLINEDSSDGRCDMFDEDDPHEEFNEDGIAAPCTRYQLYFLREIHSLRQ